MDPFVNPDDAVEFEEDMYCAMCLTEDPKLKYFPDTFVPETFFCEECWEKCQIQERMIDEGLEQDPEVEN